MHGRGRGHRHGAFGAWGGFEHGPLGPFGRDIGDFGRRPRAQRGDVRAGVLALLAEEPRNGYQIIQELRRRSQGLWRPSPGSVYPTLQQLEDEGLVESVPGEVGKRRLYRLTPDGQTYVDEHAEALAAPWTTVTDSVGDDAQELFALLRQVGMAAFQVSQAGTPAQLERAKQILAETRRTFYRMLAEDDQEDTEA